MSRSILAGVDDLFFASKIRATAEHLGISVRFARSRETLIQAAKDEMPQLIIADLQTGCLDAIALAKELKADEQLLDIPLVGFFSHVQVQLQKQAQEAGYDQVLPRSAFTKNLTEILQSSSET